MAGYSPYELFRTLIHRVGWPSETERQAALESVNEFERVGLFGNMVEILECKHERKESRGYPPVTECTECGRLM